MKESIELLDARKDLDSIYKNYTIQTSQLFKELNTISFRLDFNDYFSGSGKAALIK